MAKLSPCLSKPFSEGCGVSLLRSRSWPSTIRVDGINVQPSKASISPWEAGRALRSPRGEFGAAARPRLAARPHGRGCRPMARFTRAKGVA